MNDSGLPEAKLSHGTVTFGNITVQPVKPNESIEKAREGLQQLEKAAKEGVFQRDESSE
jgi:hypothetical protein